MRTRIYSAVLDRAMSAKEELIYSPLLMALIDDACGETESGSEQELAFVSRQKPQYADCEGVHCFGKVAVQIANFYRG